MVAQMRDIVSGGSFLHALAGRLNNRPDSEHEQALVRIIIGAACWAYVLYLNASDVSSPFLSRAFILLSCFIPVAVGIFVLITIWPKAKPSRRVFGIFLDLGTLSYLMYLLGEHAAVVLSLYLWVTIGNGLRYGSRYLYAAMVVSLAGFIIVFNASSYWITQRSVATGLLIALVALPLYFSMLLRRLDRQNKELKSLYEQMAKFAIHDVLTGLPNRRQFYERLEQILVSTRRRHRAFAILYIDFDGFKAINDSFGHAVGDRLIQMAARRLESCARKCDIVARIGGDEFIVLLDEIAPSDVTKVAEKVLEAMSEPFMIADRTIYVTTSVGVAVYPDAGEDLDSLIHHADLAMYQAKRGGKNRYQVYLGHFA